MGGADDGAAEGGDAVGSGGAGGGGVGATCGVGAGSEVVAIAAEGERYPTNLST